MTSSIRLADGLGRDAVLDVVGVLDPPAPVGLSQRLGHGIGGDIGVEDGFSGDVPGRPAERLDEGGRGAEEPLLSASRMRTSDTSGRSRPSLRRLIPIRAVEFALPQVPQDVHPLKGFDVGVKVADPEAELVVVPGSAPRPSRLVSVVTRVRSFLSARLAISRIRSSTWPLTGRTSTSGRQAVGRMICSMTRPPGLADLEFARRSPRHRGPGRSGR